VFPGRSCHRMLRLETGEIAKIHNGGVPTRPGAALFRLGWITGSKYGRAIRWAYRDAFARGNYRVGFPDRTQNATTGHQTRCEDYVVVVPVSVMACA